MIGVRALWAGLLVCLASLAAQPSVAQVDDAFREACPYEQRTEPACVEARAVLSSRAYGLGSLSEASGEQFRIFILDDWERERFAIVVARPANAAPSMEMRYPQEGQPSIIEPLSAELWYEIARNSLAFDRNLIPQPPDPNVICIHAPTVVVERRRSDGTIIRARGNGCDNHYGRNGYLAYRFGVETHQLISDSLVRCAGLNREFFGSAWDRLRTCAFLEGDIITASEVANHLYATGLVSDFDEPANPRRALNTDVELIFASGQTITGKDATAAYWHENFLYLSPTEISGDGPDNARVTVSIDLTYEDAPDAPDRIIDGAVLHYQMSNLGYGWEIVRIELPEPNTFD